MILGKERHCLCCNNLLGKRQPRYSNKQWEKRKYCSKTCRAEAQKSPNFVHNKKHTKETKTILSLRFKGVDSPRKGCHLTQETKKILRKRFSGSKSPLWIDGRSKDIEYQKFRARLKVHRRRTAEGQFAKVDWERLKKKYNYTCPSCGVNDKKSSLTIDHIVPITKGGSNHIHNIQPLCKACNSKKQTKIIHYNPRGTVYEKNYQRS